MSGSLRPDSARRGLAGVQIGGSTAAPDHSFRGALEEVALWAEARSPAQLSTVHLSQLLLEPRGGKAGAKNLPKKLLAYWPMNDGWGTGVADATGRGYDCARARLDARARPPTAAGRRLTRARAHAHLLARAHRPDRPDRPLERRCGQQASDMARVDRASAGRDADVHDGRRAVRTNICVQGQNISGLHH